MSQGFTFTRAWINGRKLRYPVYGMEYSSFLPHYNIWAWKQSELYRQLYEAQMEHLRRVYRRQWYESYRTNADEYISVYSVTKAAQYKKWKAEVILEDEKRRNAMWKRAAADSLKQKQNEMWREFSEKQFFYWYERASERLQHMSQIKWIARPQLSTHIQQELQRYVARDNMGKDSSEHRYPLNFVGQMPLLEDSEGNIVGVPHHLAPWHHLRERDLQRKSDAADETTSGAKKSEMAPSSKVFFYGPEGDRSESMAAKTDKDAMFSVDPHSISSEPMRFTTQKSAPGEETRFKAEVEAQESIDATFENTSESKAVERSAAQMQEDKERLRLREREGLSHKTASKMTKKKTNPN